ncbi:MAG TPA: hypothetical protein VJX67_22070 [Blastocatellia bacterium]|nr:hypothetical protein [Blastocatellia bacterium]
MRAYKKTKGVCAVIFVALLSLCSLVTASSERRTNSANAGANASSVGESPSDPTGTDRGPFDDYSWKVFIEVNSTAGIKKSLIWEGSNPSPEFFDPASIFSANDQQLSPTIRARMGQRTKSGAHPAYALANHANNELSVVDNPSTPIHEGAHNLDRQAASKWPLIDQEGNYVVDEIRVNKVTRDYIKAKGIDTVEGLKKYIGSRLDFPAGSIAVKATWRVFPRSWEHDSSKQAILKRYYWEHKTIIVDKSQDEDGHGFVIRDAPVGLVALHIIQKTVNNPQWIWSTFEQVDNYEVPADSGAPSWLTPTFNSGKQSEETLNNRQPLLASGAAPPSDSAGFPIYFWHNPGGPAAEYTPTASYRGLLLPYTTTAVQLYSKPQVQLCPNEKGIIPDATNKRWQAIAGAKAGWMRYYKLDVTQWIYDNAPLPKNADNVAIARNSVLETYLLGDEALATQVPATDKLDTGACFGTPRQPKSTLSDLITATIIASKAGPTTWSSCTLCHQLAQFAFGAQPSQVVDTDHSFLFKTYLKEPQVACPN